ncbi:MAG: 2,3-bisphosphoglycerate-independent phosphoglycerate mutase [Rhodospirillales bacterium]|nr:2,3-bisphosphoglycerate-independent phosphoglycerate mutase [Rhodospirillales bacterium]
MLTEKPGRARPRPVMLCILDGWGNRADTDFNAIAIGKTPNWDRIASTNPRARLNASGLEVGLPEGQMGNSEVGHMNIGAGRVVMQDLPRIDLAAADGSMARNPALLEFVAALKKSGGTCHLMGLMSPGGVHSHQDHMVALARAVRSAGVPVIVHALLDGRDTPPRSGKGFMEKFLADAADVAGLTVGVVSGRYYAMDRDKRWERVEKAYRALVDAMGERQAPDAASAIQRSYDENVSDEFVLPTVIEGYAGMKDGDGLLMANFRSDRVRQILGALADPAFDGFERARVVNFAARLGMTEYSDELDAFFPALFTSLDLEDILGQVVSEAGLTQLRVAETEKYAHVTFFFNGGREMVFDGEDRIMVPSPKVATYDLKPEMSALEVTDRLVEAIGSGNYDLIVANFANGDMVGHSGILEAAVKAVETVDACLGRVEAAILKAGGVLLVTADHGNCEMMRDPETGQPHTAHTLNQVPIVLVNGPAWAGNLRDGRLADIAPTLLRFLGLAQPAAMTGRSLLLEEGARKAAAG